MYALHFIICKKITLKTKMFNYITSINRAQIILINLLEVESFGAVSVCGSSLWCHMSNPSIINKTVTTSLDLW